MIEDPIDACWDDVAEIAGALRAIASANLSEKRTALMCAPLIEQIAEIGRALVREAQVDEGA